MRLSKKHWILLQAAAFIVVVGGFLLVRPHLARAINVNPTTTPNGMNGDGTPINPFIIQDCQNLQDINLNLGSYYSINNDIDCSATSTWNTGLGFSPIGSNATPFTGQLDGHGHTISSLYVNQATNNAATDNRVGLFGKVSNGYLLNFTVSNASIYGIQVTDFAATGGIAAEILNSTIDHVNFNGDIILGSCNLQENIGGLIGVANSYDGDNSTNTINASSASGSITSGGNAACGQFLHTVGGLIGKTSDAIISNVYANMNITISGTQEHDCLGTLCRNIGGLIGKQDAAQDPTIITNSYSAGSVTIQNDTGEHLSYNVGGFFGVISSNVDVHHAFSTTSINVPSTCNNISCDGSVRNIGGLIGTTNSFSGNWEDYWYDYATLAQAHCTGDTTSNDSYCQTMNNDGSQPDYLKGTGDVNPINNWRLVDVWQISNGQWPQLRSALPNPDAPSEVNTTIESSTQISVNWNASAPADQLKKYVVLCRLDGQSSWNVCADDINPNTTAAQLSGLVTGSSYNIAVYSVDKHNYIGQLSQVVNATTATPGFILINSCTDLQNINNNLDKNYELARNIDCSDSVNWDGGRGFRPLGVIDFVNSEFIDFSGIFKGNNYTISNLYCERADSPLDACALFGYTDQNALIQDVRLKSFHMHGSYVTTSLIGAAVHTTVTNVQASDIDVHGEGHIAGGLIGVATPQIVHGPGATIIERSSVTGTINLNGSAAVVGGFIGSIQPSDINIQNNYSNMDIAIDSGTLVGGFAGDLELDSSSYVQNNYSAGSLNVLSNDPDLNLAPSYNPTFPTNISLTGGFAGLLLNNLPNNINNNFSHVSLASASPEALLGGFMSVSAYALDLSGNYFDADYANVSTCENTTISSGSTCTAITGQPDYFKNNSTNPPLNHWDFANIWAVNPSFPLFSYSSTTSITSIPPERLNPNPTPTPGTNNQTPTPVAGSTIDTTAKVNSGTSDITVNQTDETGVLGAIKHFVRSLPLAVVVGFPYALFALLLIAALVLLIELIRELRRLHELQALLTKQRLLAEERDAFWHLAANYLRAPVTLIVGGAEALHEANAIDAAAGIAALAASLQKKVADIMAKIEGSTSLQAINNVQPRKATQVARQAIFIVPVLSVAALTILTNYAASSFRNLNPGFIGYATQIIGFVIATILFYWVLSLLTNGKRRRQAAQDQLDRHTNELANARHELINDTARTLNPDLTKLEGMIKLLPAAVTASAAGAISTLSEGTSRLREIVNSFTMLIKVQEGTGVVTAAPGASTIDLSGILAKTRAKLTPQITAKHVNISAPAVPLAVTAEADLANQVLESIIANAVDYSPEGGTVKVEARRLQDAIQLRVSDQGQGIDKKQLDHLFQPFVRTDGKSAMDMSHGGFGINLYLDKLILEQIGGSIVVDSTPGKGTAFTMTWPV